MTAKKIGGKTVNEILLDLSIEYGVSLERLKGSEVRKALELLAELDEELLVQITGRIDRLGPVERQLFGAGKYTTERLQKLRAELRRVADDSYALLIGDLRATLDQVAKDAAAFEAAGLNRTVNAVIKGEFGAIAVSANALRAVVRERPIEGKHLAKYVKDWSETKKALVEQEIKKGFLASETTRDIIKRVAGPAGLVRSRNRAEAVVRTAIQNIAAGSRELLWEQNADIIKGVRWVSTLDSDTCVRCARLDGKVYKVGEGPRPTLHEFCRCTTVAVLTGFNIKGERASIFGPVPDDVTFDDFLKRRGAAFQDDVLGVTKGRLYRRGGVKLDDFVDKSGREFNLSDLAERNAGAFLRAGLDPSDYR